MSLTPTESQQRLAVLIDADNTSHSYAEACMQEIAKYGVATVRRAYGDWSDGRLARWKPQLNRLAIQPVQQFAYVTGKNATDFALVIDAMDLLYAGNVDGFVIVSSDSDFTRLANRLRESGKVVYGIGAEKTPVSFRSACLQFFTLEVIKEGGTTEDAADDANADAAPTLPNLQSLLTRAINAADKNGNGWATLRAVERQLVRIETSFDARLYGKNELIDLAEEQKYVDVDRNGSGPDMIRLRSARPAKKTTAKKAASKKAAAKKTPQSSG